MGENDCRGVGQWERSKTVVLLPAGEQRKSQRSIIVNERLAVVYVEETERAVRITATDSLPHALVVKPKKLQPLAGIVKLARKEEDINGELLFSLHHRLVKSADVPVRVFPVLALTGRAAVDDGEAFSAGERLLPMGFLVAESALPEGERFCSALALAWRMRQRDGNVVLSSGDLGG